VLVDETSWELKEVFEGPYTYGGAYDMALKLFQSKLYRSVRLVEEDGFSKVVEVFQ
jgi:hypothetical protein